MGFGCSGEVMDHDWDGYRLVDPSLLLHGYTTFNSCDFSSDWTLRVELALQLLLKCTAVDNLYAHLSIFAAYS